MHPVAHVAPVVGSPLVEHHQLIGILDRQLAEHELIHQSEDGGVGADTQCQRKDRYGGEQRAAANRAEREAQIEP